MEIPRTAIVTGAARGIGLATALRLAREGWQVLALDSDPAPLAAHPQLHAWCADVTREEEINRAVEAALGRFSRLDAIVSNAGVSEFASLAGTSLEDWNRILATNLTPAFLLAKAAETALRQSSGAIVLIASTRAHMSEPDTHAYSATKGGLVALAHSLAISLGPQIRVNSISPGWIHVSDDELSPEDHAQHPAGRVGNPADIAAAVSYLLSPDAGFITGAEFIIDGGMTRKMIYT